MGLKQRDRLTPLFGAGTEIILLLFYLSFFSPLALVADKYINKTASPIIWTDWPLFRFCLV